MEAAAAVGALGELLLTRVTDGAANEAEEEEEEEGRIESPEDSLEKWLLSPSSLLF